MKVAVSHQRPASPVAEYMARMNRASQRIDEVTDELIQTIEEAKKVFTVNEVTPLGQVVECVRPGCGRQYIERRAQGSFGHGYCSEACLHAER